MRASNDSGNEPATARGQRTRQKILAAAEEVFGERGYEAASIVDITRSAGVAQGTFYLYFPSKKAVFAELVDELGAMLRRTLATAVVELDDRLAVERAGLQAFLVFVQQHKNLYRIVRQAEFVDEELYRAYYRRLAKGYEEGLARAMKAGQVRKLDPEAVAFALMGIFDFLGMRWVLWEGKLPPKRVLDDVFALVRQGLGLGNPQDANRTDRE
ncbi:MAG TPA: TetR/AcrR family transcriptional regulator [Nannocystaceae bacterium]|nr:TetR/AcrR family transcriptional regulator [Nannocystaceae bacterium]